MDVTQIPRLLVDLLVYLFQVIPPFLPTILVLTTPIALGAMCGVLCERSGVVNIGIEGIMLMAAFFAYLTGFALHQSIGALPALVIGVVVGVVVGVLMGSIHAWLSISVRTDQIISGVFLNVLALGLTAYLNRLIITPSGRGGAGQLPKFRLPNEIGDIPVLGAILEMFLNQGPIAMSLIVIVVGLQILLFRSRWGLRTRSVGEHPKAADTVGINVIRLRYRNVILGCAMAGLAGAFLTLETNGTFQNGMTNGRGFIALAAVILGRWTPVGAFLGALLFGFATGTQIMVGVAPPPGDLGAIMRGIPTQFYAALPFVLTIIVLAGVVGRSIAPASVGIPYEKEARA
ncbi:MAG TPA: ABC transporter permease [Vitreimonas sp.]|nr:ABC transporter permease [Vitreimonas sp.]